MPFAEPERVEASLMGGAAAPQELRPQNAEAIKVIGTNHEEALFDCLGLRSSDLQHAGVIAFLIFAGHYAAVTYIRKEALFQFGVLAMVIQGVVLSLLYSRRAGGKSTTKSAVGFSWLMGSFLVAYTAFAEAAKYVVPSAASWIAVELGVGVIQFTVFGVLLGLVYRERTDRGARGGVRLGEKQ